MRKKTIRLPNGYGQIRKLSRKCYNQYGVYPPQLETDQDGRRLPVKAICYVPSWTVAFAVLTAYKAGRYYPGYELTLTDSPETLAAALADYGRVRRSLLGIPEPQAPTFREVYEAYYHDKFETGKAYSKSSRDGCRTGFKNLAPLHDRSIKDIKLDDLQSIIDDCPLKHASVEMMVHVLKQVYKYADAHELVDRDISKFIKIKRPDDDEHGVAFTEDELAILWDHREDPTIELLLIMCFAGYRIGSYKTLQVNLEERYFLGGNKTKAGKDLCIPIHTGIYDLVKARMSRHKHLLYVSTETYRQSLYEALARLNIPRHTPHDCKHTFSALCEKYGVNERDRKRMLGHAVGDITNDIYGHRNLEDLRAEIEKIQPSFLSKASQKRDRICLN